MVSVDACHFEIQDADQFLIVCSLYSGPDGIGSQDLAVDVFALVIYCQESSSAFAQDFIEMDRKLDAFHGLDLQSQGMRYASLCLHHTLGNTPVVEFI